MGKFSVKTFGIRCFCMGGSLECMILQGLWKSLGWPPQRFFRCGHLISGFYMAEIHYHLNMYTKITENQYIALLKLFHYYSGRRPSSFLQARSTHHATQQVHQSQITVQQKCQIPEVGLKLTDSNWGMGGMRLCLSIRKNFLTVKRLIVKWTILESDRLSLPFRQRMDGHL